MPRKRSPKPSSVTGQIPLEFDLVVGPSWPEQGLFPLNRRGLDGQGRTRQLTVREYIDSDISRSGSFLIVTGFTSLGHIIDTFGADRFPDTRRVRILLGVEPNVYPRKRYDKAPLSEAVWNYWWNEGISPLQCGVVLRTIELIEQRVIDFRVLDHVHAKLYVGDTHATLGSANFSINGLTKQEEANIRLAHEPRETRDASLAGDIRTIAENFFADGEDFNTRMIELLQGMLKFVKWEEALARAMVEVLESDFLKKHDKLRRRFNDMRLWPSQWQGIARGMQILQQQGNLLVADPTGSGKTRMVSALQVALAQRLHAIGEGDRTYTTIICPPVVMDGWEGECLNGKLEVPRPLSHGLLSNAGPRNEEKAKQQLANGRILIMDEAHNYLNQGSKRSRYLSGHGADHVILSTATPINRKAEDLLRLVELLDPDNLSDTELTEYKRLRKQRPLVATEATRAQLRSYIWRFTLRRTKKQLNALIAQEPEAYTNHLGEQCRYPQHEALTYATGGTAEDLVLAKEIHKAAAELKGLIHLRNIRRPFDRPMDTVADATAYMQNRLLASQSLARYRLEMGMRSSRAALVEHIHGTEKAKEWFALGAVKKNASGDVVSTLKAMGLPKVDKELRASIPAWLRDQTAFDEVRQQEINVYERIASMARRMSDARERTKAAQLREAISKHGAVVAFDHTVVSLHQIAQFVNSDGSKHRVIIAKGGDKTHQKEVLEALKLESTVTDLVVLCSDSLSEGVNMQHAGAVVLMDMPSVLRLAEQRVGRIDRLDSPHQRITVYWPDDPEPFGLRGDRKLFRTLRIADQLIGNNMEPPLELARRYEEMGTISAADAIAEFQQEDDDTAWENMKDAFGEVHALKQDPGRLVSDELYQDMCKVSGTVRCRVSYARATIPWAFFAMRGTDQRAPRWIFIDHEGRVQSDYNMVCTALRARLTDAENTKYTRDDLDRFIKLYRRNERAALPHKKRRALDVAEHLLERQVKHYENERDREQYMARELLQLFRYTTEEYVVDNEHFADLWLEVLLPMLQERREERRRSREFISIMDLKTNRLRAHFPVEALRYIRENVRFQPPLDAQLAACIVGVTDLNAAKEPG